MLEALAKYLPVVTGSMLKFILGPLTGFPLGLSYWETYACTVVGMMTTVTILSLLGTPARLAIFRFIDKLLKRKRKIFTPYNKRMVRLWRKYGLVGVAFLSPLLLSPLGGTLLAISFGERPARIVLFMFVSAVFWGSIITGFIYWLGPLVDGYLR